MPYFYDPNLDPNNDDEQNPQLAGSGEILGGAGQTVSQSSGAPTGQQTRSERFQNLNDYLAADANNNFADEFSDKVENDIGKAQTAQNDAAQSFKNQSDQGTTKYDDSFTQSAINDPYAFSQNQDNVQKFKAQKDSQYKGPNSFADSAESYQKAYGATQKAQDFSKNYETEGGRFALLDNYFGRPGYNQGEKNLDQLLVQNNAKTGENITKARDNANAIQRNFDSLTPQLGQYVANNREAANQARSKTREALGLNADNTLKATDNVAGNGAFQDIAEGLDTKVTNRQAELDKLNAALSPVQGKTALGQLGQDLNPYGLDASGFNQNIDLRNVLADRGIAIGGGNDYWVQPFQAPGQDFLGVSPNNYLSNMGYQDVNRTTVVDPDTAKRLRALSQLADIETPYLDPSAVEGAQYGSAKNPAFDAQGFTKAVGDKHTALQQEFQDALDAWLNGYSSEIHGIKNPQTLRNEGNRIRAKYGLGEV